MSFVIKQTGETGDRYQPVYKIAATLLNPKILPPTTIMNHSTLICLLWFGKNLDEKFTNRRILWILLWWEWQVKNIVFTSRQGIYSALPPTKPKLLGEKP